MIPVAYGSTRKSTSKPRASGDDPGRLWLDPQVDQ